MAEKTNEQRIADLESALESLRGTVVENKRLGDGNFKAAADQIDGILAKLNGKKPAPAEIPATSKLRGSCKGARFNTNETTRAEIADLYETGPDGKQRRKKVKSAKSE
jgi:hypothetical protein